MADLPKLPKRPDYFQAQFLVVRDFQDEQTYHAEMLRRHNRGLHEWGVVRDGLQVSMTNDKKNLSISPGSAIDSLGREIVLEADQLLSIDKVTSQFDKALSSPQDVFITISFDEVDSNAPEDKYPGTDNVTRQMQSPLIAATKSPATDGSVITLARVSVTSSNEVSQPDNSARKAASSFIARGSNLGDISLDGALSFTSKSSPNPTYPQVGLDYDSGSDGLRIRARTQNAPVLDATYMTIKRGTGNVGIGTSEPAAMLHVGSGAIQVGTVGDFVTLIDNSLTHWYQNEKNPRYTINRDLVASGWAGLGFAPPNNPIEKAGVAVGISSSRALGFYTSNGNALTERVRIDSTGNVGIGITTPQAPLHVGGLIIAYNPNQNDGPPVMGPWGGAGDRLLFLPGSGNPSSGETTGGSHPTSLGIGSDSSLWYSVGEWTQHEWYVGGARMMVLSQISNTMCNLTVNGPINSNSPSALAMPAMGKSGGTGDRMVLQGGSDVSHPYSLGIDNNNLWYSVPTGARHSWHVGGTEMLRIDSSGKVGIGTTAPGAKLSVVGDPATVNVETKEIVRLVRSGVAGVKNQNSAGFLVGAFEQGVAGRSRLDIALAGTPNDKNQWGGLPDTTVMSMLANGSVGIGTTSPGAKLDVADTSAKTTKSILARLSEGNTAGAGTYLGMQAYDTQPMSSKSFALEHYFYGKLNSAINFYRGGGETGGFLSFSTGSGKEQMWIYDGGNVKVGGSISCGGKIGLKSSQWGTYVSAREDKSIKQAPALDTYEYFTLEMACSRAFKENISDLTDVEALATLQNLTPVKYDYKGEKSFRQNLGFIAEDMPDNLASEDRKSVSPFEVIPVLTRVAKEQQETITALQETVRTLQEQMKRHNTIIAGGRL